MTLIGVVFLGVKGIQGYYKNEAAERALKADERKAMIEKVASDSAKEAGTAAAKQVLSEFTLGWAKPMEVRLGGIENDLAGIKKQLTHTNDRIDEFLHK